MEHFDNVKSIIRDEISRLKSAENVDQFLEINKNSESNAEIIQKSFICYIAELKTNEKHLDEITLLINELIQVIGKKFKQFTDENFKMTNEKFNNSEELKEKLDLEKSQLRIKYFENNACYINMISTMKTANEQILDIENYLSDATATNKICEDNLIAKERALEAIRRQKEQEEAAKLEAERKELERVKEAALEEKARQQEMERMKKIIEEENKHSDETVDHFIKMKYEVPYGEFGDNGLGCTIKVLPDFVASKSDIIVELIDPLSINCTFNGTEEIISNIIQIKSKVNECEDLKFDQAFSVVLPHTMTRNQARDIKIFKFVQNELRWISVDTQDVSLEDIDKTNAKFVEAVFDELPLIVTVVSIPRVEDLKYNKKGCNWSAAVDCRVSLTIPPGAVKINQSMNITTLTFEAIQELKAKCKGTHADNIYAFSPMLKIEAAQRKLLKPLIISLPLPQKQIKTDTTGMGIKVFGSSNEARPKTNFATQDVEEKICLVSLDSNKKWVENTQLDVELDDKKDAIKFEVDKMMEMTFMGIRAKVDATSDQISKGVEIIMDHFKQRQIKIIVAHHNQEPNLLLVMLCLSHKLERQLRLIKDEGFNENETQISHELEINEREIIALRFRGNTKVEKESEDHVLKFMYCSQLKNKVKIRLEVIDKYAQRSKSKFEGFLTITTSKWIKKPQPRGEGQPRKGPPQMIDVEEIFPIFEALLEIPKDLPSSSSKVLSQNFHFISRDSVTEDFIKHLSIKVKDDWKPLAKALNLPRNRIEEIDSLSENNKNTPIMAYEVLKLWIMHLPVSKNKEKILNKALNIINRQDILEEIQT